jgi:PKD repeat protein
MEATLKLLQENITSSFHVAFYADSIAAGNEFANVSVDGVDLSAGIEHSYTVTVTWSNIPAGVHTIFVVVDAANVIDEGTEKNELMKLVTVKALFVGIAPIPKAGIDVEVEPNTEVQFTGSGTDDDGTIVKYEWDLNGDGVYDWSSSLNGITTHIYNKEGTYTAVLRVTDNDGFTSTDSRIITVSKASGGGDDDGFLPAPSLAAAVAAVAVIALRRPRKA